MLSLISGASFSPSSLTYELNVGEEDCQTIFLELDGNSEVNDVWASSYTDDWKVSNFDLEGVEHGLNIEYSGELDGGYNELEVCVSGENEGEYHGAILIKQNQEGDSIVQLAIWLKVVIGDEVSEVRNENSGSSGSTGSGGSPSNNQETINEEEGSEEENGGTFVEESGNSITGNVVGFGSGNYSIIAIIVILLIVGGAFYFISKKKGREYERNYGPRYSAY